MTPIAQLHPANIFLPDGTLAAIIEGNGSATSTYYVHPDHLGSTHVLTNASSTIVSGTDFYPYGEKRIDSSPNLTDRQFIGERFDDESELSYLNARYYDGGRGQFLSQDPMFWSGSQKLVDPQSLNSYSYAGNNPITYLDPKGEDRVNVQRLLQAGGGAGFLNHNFTAFYDVQGLPSLVTISGGQSSSGNLTYGIAFGSPGSAPTVYGGANDVASYDFALASTLFAPPINPSDKIQNYDYFPTQDPEMERKTAMGMMVGAILAGQSGTKYSPIGKNSNTLNYNTNLAGGFNPSIANTQQVVPQFSPGSTWNLTSGASQSQLIGAYTTLRNILRDYVTVLKSQQSTKQSTTKKN